MTITSTSSSREDELHPTSDTGPEFKAASSSETMTDRCLTTNKSQQRPRAVATDSQSDEKRHRKRDLKLPKDEHDEPLFDIGQESAKHLNSVQPAAAQLEPRRTTKYSHSSLRYSPTTSSLALQERPLVPLMLMFSFIIQLFAIHTLAITTSSVSWGQHHRANHRHQEDQMRLSWASAANGGESASKLIPSARYVYTSTSSLAPRMAATMMTTRSDEPRKESKREKILLLHSQLNQLKRQLDEELANPHEKITESGSASNSLGHQQSSGQLDNPAKLTMLPTLGSPCLSTSFCNRSIKNSQCNLETFTCGCLSEHVKFNSTTCLAPSLLGYECQLDSQCQQRVPESVCQSGKCACPGDSFVPYRKNKCLTASKLNDYCLLDGQCQLNDKHSFCKWKIQNIYGTCKCPPNYKLLSDKQNNLRCAPRLGDACLTDQECQLATENSVCSGDQSAAEPKQVMINSGNWRLHNKWPTSSASNNRCSCSEGFRESASQLECERIPSPLVAKTNASLSDATDDKYHKQPEQQQDSHKYEMIVIPQEHEKQTNSNTSDTGRGTEREELEIQVMPMESKPRQKPTTTTTTTKAPTTEATTTTSTTSTTTTTERTTTVAAASQTSAGGVLQVSQAVYTNSSQSSFRMSSLGKPCKWRQECQARDPFSDCIGGICECLAPSDRCRASRTGCPADTFQCRNGQCISWYFVCDQFKNCDDGSDEDDCKPRHCPRESFQCHQDGVCLTKGKVCNGKRDCQDGSDELDCGQQLTKTNSNNNNNGSLGMTRGGCHPDAFTCTNGQCLPGYVFCNAVEDCADGSDEDELVCERQRPPAKGTSANLVANLEASSLRNASEATASSGSPQHRETSSQQQKQQQQQQQESPLVKTDRASIEKLMAALALGKWTPESRGRVRITEPNGGSNSGGRRSRLLVDARPAKARSQLAASKQDTTSLVNGQLKHQPADECPRWAFTCRNGKCRSSAILCSGVDGCGDNSDEDQCEVCQCEAPPSASRPSTGALARATNSRRRNGWIAPAG